MGDGMRIRLRDVGDGATLVDYPDSSDSEANRAAVETSRSLTARRPKGLLEAIPGARTLFLLFDPTRLDRRDLIRRLSAGRTAPAQSRDRRFLRIPVCYGGSAGLDLEDLSGRLGISPSELARRHSQARYTVAFLGFAPGFPYLVGLPQELRAPRLPTPRTRVPAGAVAIGGEYTGIYPSETPGGWRLIGRSPVRLFDPEADPPSLLLPGDEVLFEPIDEWELSRLLARIVPRKRGPSAETGRALFRVLSPGLSTSIQGAPRFGWGAFGVPAGGAMDATALAAGNTALGNPPGAAALEMALVGPEIEVLSRCRFCLSGAGFPAELNRTTIEPARVYEDSAGSRLRFGRALRGARAYLCVEGGLRIPQDAPVSRRLQTGDIVETSRTPGERSEERAGILAPFELREAAVCVVLGPQQEDFAQEALETFLGSPYRVSSASDRRGIRLEGPRVRHIGSAEIPPEGTALGAIQVPPDGLPIVLGPDRPVTGGYAKIATVIGADWPLLAQAAPGSELRFRAVGLAEAVAARQE